MSAAVIRELSTGCEGDCEFVIDELETTLAGWQQRFDKFGNDISPPNPNRVRSIYRCCECGKTWDVVEKNGKIQSSELMRGD